MANLDEYSSLSPAAKKAYLDGLSADERHALLRQMQSVTRSPSRYRPTAAPLPFDASDDGDAVEFIDPPAPAVPAPPQRAALPQLPTSTPWTRNEMSTLIIFTLFFPPAALAFFIASQLREGTRKQGFTVLTVGFVCVLVSVVLYFWVAASLAASVD